MSKLILGTASFGPKPYGDTELVPLFEVEKILNVAYKGGITILEGAEFYHCDQILGDNRFELIYKVKHPYSVDRVLQNVKRDRLMGLLYHHTTNSRAQQTDPDSRIKYTGSSIYNSKQIVGSENILEVPLSIENREFEKITANVKLVRSIFGRGEYLKKYSVTDCLNFVRNNSTVHGVIVGVNKASQLQQILDVWMMPRPLPAIGL